MLVFYSTQHPKLSPVRTPLSLFSQSCFYLFLWFLILYFPVFHFDYILIITIWGFGIFLRIFAPFLLWEAIASKLSHFLLSAFTVVKCPLKSPLKPGGIDVVLWRLVGFDLEFTLTVEDFDNPYCQINSSHICSPFVCLGKKRMDF